MADRYFGIDRGAERKDVTEDSSTTSKDVEVRIDLAPGMSMQEVYVMLEYIKDKMMSDNWPPA